MERRGWLWNKKKSSSDKNLNAHKPVAPFESSDSNLSSVACLGDQDMSKIKNYVQIPMESYTHMSELEGQVKTLEEQVKALEERLSDAHSELNKKDDLVKQHAKVAEEAVSGWEKSDAEVVSLKRELESITLLKLSVDDRASHLDGALKECMTQIRNVKKESEQRLQDVILMKTKQWEMIKRDLEEKIEKLDQGLLRASNEKAAFWRSLQESSNRLMNVKEEKSQAEAEIELLRNNIQSYEKEITSLKYEIHVVSNELDIRNEEKNISVRSSEALNRQHIEDVKKIAKLEAECQKLRGLVRKKLPGPAALAQMKLEVESSGGINSENYLRKPFMKNDNLQESQFLTKQLMALEEEKKTLKEALATSNSELQASRKLYVKAVSKLKILEAQIQFFNQQRSSQKSSLKNPPSITSITDDRSEDPESPVESYASSNPDLCDIRRGDITSKSANLELMDDFLEMEKMACLSGNVNKQSDDALKAGDLLPKQSASSGYPSILESNPNDASYDQKSCILDIGEVVNVDIGSGFTEHQDVAAAVSSIHHYVLTVGREAIRLLGNCHGGNELDVNLDEFSSSLNQFMTNKLSLEKFVLKLSHALAKTIEFHLNYLRKVNSESSLEEFASTELEKDGKAVEHAEYNKLLEEMKVQLASSQKSYSVAEIKLKCMTESYKSLELHVEELEGENKFMKERLGELKNELVEQKQSLHNTLSSYKEIEEKMQRDTKCLGRASDCVEDFGIGTRKQDTELSAAEKKLAECQETLHLLTRQFQVLCPQMDITKSQSHHGKKFQVNEKLLKTCNGWSYSYGSSNSYESEGFSSQNFGSTVSSLSDSEECFSLNSSMSSSQPAYVVTKSNSSSFSLKGNTRLPTKSNTVDK